MPHVKEREPSLMNVLCHHSRPFRVRPWRERIPQASTRLLPLFVPRAQTLKKQVLGNKSWTCIVYCPSSFLRPSRSNVEKTSVGEKKLDVHRLLSFFLSSSLALQRCKNKCWGKNLDEKGKFCQSRKKHERPPYSFLIFPQSRNQAPEAPRHEKSGIPTPHSISSLFSKVGRSSFAQVGAGKR